MPAIHLAANSTKPWTASLRVCASMQAARFNTVIGRAGLTIWWALRTPQRRGPIGKLNVEEGERVGKGEPLPNQIGVWRALCTLLGFRKFLEDRYSQNDVSIID